MRVIEIINLAMKHNELLVKWVKGEIWFADKTVPQSKKDEQEPKFVELLKEISDNISKLEKISISFDENEILEVIEIPQELKREKVEIWLEKWRDFKKSKEEHNSKSNKKIG